MGYIALFLIMATLAFVGNHCYMFRHLNKFEVQARIDETERTLAQLSIIRTATSHDREKQHVCDVVIARHESYLRRLEKRLGEFGANARVR